MDTSYLDKYYPSLATDDAAPVERRAGRHVAARKAAELTTSTGPVNVKLDRQTGMYVVRGRGPDMRFKKYDAAMWEVRRRNPLAHI